MRYLIFSLLLALTACTPPASGTSPDNGPAQEQQWIIYPKSDGKPYFQSHQGATFLADLTIGRIALRGDSASRRLVLEDGITLRTFREGVLFMEMKAQSAVCRPPWKVVEFSGMTGFSLDAEEVEMENMTWNAGEPLVRTEGFVQVVGKNKLLEGRGMEASLDMNYYSIEKVSSVIDLGDSP